MHKHFFAIAKIEKHLKNDAAKKIDRIVRVQDIIAYNVNTNQPTSGKKQDEKKSKKTAPPKGEHNAELISRKYDEKSAQQESETQVIDRIFTQMARMAEITANVHLENFINPKKLLNFEKAKHNKMPHPEYKMTPGKENDITRLLVNEFSFYPNKARGPLSKDGFTNLLDKAHEMAAYYPENLHLVFGTLPVQFKMFSAKKNKTISNLQNLVIIAVCGKNPQIKIFVKAQNAYGDPEYDGSSLAPAVNLKEVDEFFSEKAQVIIAEMKNNIGNVSEDSLAELIQLCDLLYRKRNDIILEFIEKLNAILKNIQNKKYLDSSGQSQAAFDAKELTEMCDKLFLNRQRDSSEYHPAAPALGFGEYGANVEHGGVYTITTAGGAMATFAYDVCFDQHYGLAKQRFLEKFKQARKAQEIQPIFAAHAVLSNFIQINKSHLISPTTSQADPYYSSRGESVVNIYPNYSPQIVKKEVQMDYDATFGSHIIMERFPKRKLAPLVEDLEFAVTTYNQFIIRLKAMRIYREQQTTLTDLQQVNKLINQHIIMYVIAILRRLNSTILKNKVNRNNVFYKLEKLLQNALNCDDVDFQINVLKQITQASIAGDFSVEIENCIYDAELAIAFIQQEQTASDKLCATKFHADEKKHDVKETKPETSLERENYFLHYADDRGYVDLMKALIYSREYTEKGKEKLHLAAKLKQFDLLSDVVEVHDTKFDLNQRTAKGSTALHLAAELGRIGNIFYLIEEGADPALEHRDGRTFLEIYAEKGFDVRLLLNHQHDLFFKFSEHKKQDEKSAEPHSLIHHLFKRYEMCDDEERKNLESAIMVIALDHPTSMVDEGKCIFHLAAKSKFPAILAAILTHHQIDLERKTEDGKSALLLAVEQGNMQNARLLLANGARIESLLWVASEQTAKNTNIENFLCLIAKEKPYEIYTQFHTIETRLCSQTKTTNGKDKLGLLNKQKQLLTVMQRIVSKSIVLSAKFHSWHKAPLAQQIKARLAVIENDIKKLERKLRLSQ